ncbi:MAG: 50S ribosomal protein L39e [Thaumarchaeota archaeon]|nr:50S ribosomal protein L39e [Nitrososphaerota archaeon]
MARNRTVALKKRIFKNVRRTMSVPTWVMMRTHRRVRRSAKKRSWKHGTTNVR